MTPTSTESKDGKRMKNKYICIEGIGGSGKSFLFNILKEKYKNDCNRVFVDEIFDEEHYGLDELIFSALYHTKNRFFDMGTPLTETMLLLAKKMYQYESVLKHYLESGKTVIQDRGIDTVAIYQTILILKSNHLSMSSLELVEYIHNFIDDFYPLPDTTFLLYGNLTTCIERAEIRDGVPFTENEKILLETAQQLYLSYAAKHPDRFVIIDITHKTTNEILCIIENEL